MERLSDERKVSDEWEIVKNGRRFRVEKVPGCEVVLATLRPNQSVAYGDGATYHLRYTELRAEEGLSDVQE